MGWCKKGAAKMARLRAYKYNHGKKIDLVRYQNTDPLPLVAGAEEIILSAGRVRTGNKTSAEMLAKYHGASPWGPSSRHYLWFACDIYNLTLSNIHFLLDNQAILL